MRIAFYAPMKSLDHPIPSGDRAMARALFSLLGDLGYDVFEASTFRSYERHGDRGEQERIESTGKSHAEALLAHWSADPAGRPDLWFTYHCYHKAPDWLGPAVSRGLGISYVVAEASIAPKRAGGAWDHGYRASLAAVRDADLVLAMTERDRLGLLAAVPEEAALSLFPPFVDTRPFDEPGPERGAARAALAAELGLDPFVPWLLAVGMMRDDAKRRSFELILESLGHLTDRSWQMLLVGDGPARSAIEHRAAGPISPRVRFTGALSSTELARMYLTADLYFWPGVDEAYGMAMLEAQAAGLPVVAGREGGIPEIVADGETAMLTEPRDAVAFARALATFLDDPERRAQFGRRAAHRARAVHGRGVALGRMRDALTRASERARHRGFR